VQTKPYTLRVEEYYSGRSLQCTVNLSEAETARLLRFLREEDQETDIYDSSLEARCPDLYRKLNEAAVPLMDELEASHEGGMYQAAIPEEIVKEAFSSGLAFTSTLVVSEADTAQVMGSGTLPVLATPRLAALMENAAMSAVAPILEPGMTTVGGEISIRHLSPSPVGAEVSATAVLERTEGRKLLFSLSARQGDTLIGEGTHTRFIVNTGRFMQSLR
jgi:predicted thioesterase